jgi:guanylate kinase
MAEPPTGKLVIISGPSGAGKSTVVRRLLEECRLPLKLSVSATTRAPRPAERDGVDYHFLSKEEFSRRRKAGDFLEWKEVFGRGDFYGTLREETTSGLANGYWVVLEIDVEGTLSVVQQNPEAITVFVDPGSMEELERRLRNRGTETEESIQRRLEVAGREMANSNRYRFRVVNDFVDRTAREICDILTSYVGD